MQNVCIRASSSVGRVPDDVRVGDSGNAVRRGAPEVQGGAEARYGGRAGLGPLRASAALIFILIE